MSREPSSPTTPIRPSFHTVPTTRIIRTYEEIRIPVKTEEVYPELECTICTHVMGAPQSLVPCGHSFCGPCIWEWIKTQNAATRAGPPTCPHCRSPIDLSRPIIPNILVDQIIDRKLQKLEDKPEKESLLVDRQGKLKEWREILSTLPQPSRAPPAGTRQNAAPLPSIVDVDNRRASRHFPALGAPVDVGVSVPMVQFNDHGQIINTNDPAFQLRMGQLRSRALDNHLLARDQEFAALQATMEGARTNHGTVGQPSAGSGGGVAEQQNGDGVALGAHHASSHASGPQPNRRRSRLSIDSGRPYPRERTSATNEPPQSPQTALRHATANAAARRIALGGSEHMPIELPDSEGE
ncbi:hypothetical protein L198_05993 [Cryptococcus wingfieldii CBS 7118]|uniref:RING-type domain-containing protein n=1 Tax=Cryptococcus wingfieldii CBS 7118 TaxID=1295528 RepID=A0A1E3IS72_9TREE|nr:hypothetical protein L198_05993 [Cryptococcus wingfieldii CBS 7118]ODN91473.1 hypothetical protein L198_05993 [Cryptococcus wingfieldii CBS 7118]